MAPKLSPNPGRTARFYRKNRRSRLKHRRDELARGKSPAKRRYRSQLKIARRKANPGPQQDMSHKGKRIVVESRKTNRARGGANRK
jgi:hypothetical protein